MGIYNIPFEHVANIERVQQRWLSEQPSRTSMPASEAFPAFFAWVRALIPPANLEYPLDADTLWFLQQIIKADRARVYVLCASKMHFYITAKVYLTYTYRLFKCRPQKHPDSRNPLTTSRNLRMADRPSSAKYTSVAHYV